MNTKKHYYCMFNDIHVTTSDVVVDGYKEYIGVRFEHINANDTLDYAEIIMPDRKIISSNGFNECDLNWIMSFAIDNLLLMWQMAQADADEYNHSNTEPNPETIAALKEAERIAKDPSVKSYTNLDELFSDLEQPDFDTMMQAGYEDALANRSEDADVVFARIRKRIAEHYKTHSDLSIGFCAQKAGMTKEDFIKFLGSKKISIFNYDDEKEFLEEVNNV